MLSPSKNREKSFNCTWHCQWHGSVPLLIVMPRTRAPRAPLWEVDPLIHLGKTAEMTSCSAHIR